MASFLHNPSSISILVVLYLVNFCYCFDPRLFNTSQIMPNDGAVATWYGSPNGFGSDGGACGYANAVGQRPFYSFVSAGGPSLYKSGQGCGACYQVKCTSNPACSGNPVTVVITDECPGCPEATHFDLSGTAFGAMAKPGQADALRNVGKLDVQYRRVPCYYRGVNVAFKVDAGSNAFSFSTIVEFGNGDGGLASAERKQAGASDPWLPMQRIYGANWRASSGSALRGPFSIRLTSLQSEKTIVAYNVIPSDWKAGNTYTSSVNF